MPLLVTDASPTGTASWTNALVDAMTTTDGVTGGTARTIGGLAYAGTVDSAAVTNTAAATAFDVIYSIPASTLKAGSTFRMRATIRVTNVAAAATLTVASRVGAAALATATAAAVATGDTVNIDTWLISRAVPGAAVDCVGGGKIQIAAAAVPAEAATATLANGVTLATNGALIANVQVQWSAANASSCYLESFIIDIY